MYISSVSCSIVLFNRSYLLRIIVCCCKSWLGWLWFLVCVAVQTDEDIARLSAVIAESKPVARKLAQRVQQLLTVSWLSVSNTCMNIFVIMCVVLFVRQQVFNCFVVTYLPSVTVYKCTYYFITLVVVYAASTCLFTKLLWIPDASHSILTYSLTTSLLWLLFMQPTRASLPSYCESLMLLIPY